MLDGPMNWFDDDQAGAERPRYFIESQENGTWSMFDRLTNAPAVLGDQMLVELTFELADDMLEMMNPIEADAQAREQRAN